MGRLAGFRYREIVRKLRVCGFKFDRQAAGSHEIWFNPRTDRYTTVPGSTTGSDGMFTAAKSRLLGAMATPATLRFPPPRPPPPGTPARCAYVLPPDLP